MSHHLTTLCATVSPYQTICSSSMSCTHTVRYTFFVLAMLSFIAYIAAVGLGYTSLPLLISLSVINILFCLVFITIQLLLAYKALKKPVPKPQVPSYSSLSYYFVGDKLKQEFKKISISAIQPRTQSVTLQRTDQLVLHFQHGHPLNDPFLSPQQTALLLTTNTSADLSMSIGRTLAVAGSIDKSTWETITNQRIPIGHCVCGLWNASSSQHSAPKARALIIINPPTIETIISEERRRQIKREVSLQDISWQTFFHELVSAYLQIFTKCRIIGTNSLQLEILGRNDLSSSHEQYARWRSLCYLALLDALRLDQASNKAPLKSITINDQKELPMREALIHAFN